MWFDQNLKNYEDAEHPVLLWVWVCGNWQQEPDEVIDKLKMRKKIGNESLSTYDTICVTAATDAALVV